MEESKEIVLSIENIESNLILIPSGVNSIVIKSDFSSYDSIYFNVIIKSVDLFSKEPISKDYSISGIQSNVLNISNKLSFTSANYLSFSIEGISLIKDTDVVKLYYSFT